MTETEGYGTGYNAIHHAQENPKHLMETRQQTVSTQPQPEQKPGNLERKTETDTGAGQKN
jgi:hypothetical protein